MSATAIGSGVKIGYALSSPHTWIEIPKIIGEPTIPGTERDRVETTIHGTTSLRTYIPGLADVQDLEFDVIADLTLASVHMDIQALERAQTTIWVRVQIPVDSVLSTTTYMAFQMQGRVSRWIPNSPIDDVRTISITIQFEDNYMVQQAMADQF